ncbi:MAG TPA: choice-of-anchor Q domain-containing protein, partial [Micromonosporaceae bacterium]
GEGAGDGNAGGKGGSGAGGAIFVASTGQLTISSTTFSGNTATGGAGGIPQAIAAPGDNGTGEGGAISTAGALTLTGSQLTGNNVAGGDASPTVLGVSVKAGGAGEGGGIFTSANATITDSTISGNHATGGTGGSSTSVGAAGGVAEGGGIFTSSAFVSTIRSTTLATNAVTGGPGGNNSGGTSPGPDGAARGGAVFHQSGSVLLPGEQPALIIDSTITGNDATGTSNASGGGLATTGTLGVHLASDTLAANVAADGDTLFSVPGGVNSTFTVQDTILAANASGAAVNCDAHVSDSGHNLEDSGATTSTCGLSSANNDVLVVPGTAGLASALASNGGPTQTLALSGTSSAVAAGGACTDPGSNGVALAVDQRGLPRQAPCDIGAFEGQRPVSTAAPSITGTAAAGDMLTCAPGTFSGEGNLTVAFAWLRDGSPIGSATSATYVVQTADGGHAVACKVTATGTYGSASATSATVSVPSPTAQIGTPTVHRQTDKVSKKGATNVKVGCTGPGSCSGTLQLTATATTHRHHKTHHRHVAIAKATFTIPADRTTPVSMHLTKTGRRLLNITAGHKLHLTITVNSGKRVIASAKGTLRLASKPRPKHA